MEGDSTLCLPIQCVLEAAAGYRPALIQAPPPPRARNLQPPAPLSPVQGYKMDDLLTSYVQQFLSTMKKQRGSQAPTDP